MRTKALIAAVAILAVGAATSLAQTNVYSQNVVGYINVNLVPGFNLVANQLDFDGTGTNNTVMTTFGTNLPTGSIVYAWQPASQTFASVSYGKAGWGSGTNLVNPSLNPGKAVFVSVGSAKTITFVGNVMQGNLSNPYVSGLNLIASQVPQAGLIQTDLGFTPSTGQIIFRWDSAQQKYSSPNASYGKAGWATPPGQPNLAVAEGVFLSTGSAGTWSRTFNVQ